MKRYASTSSTLQQSTKFYAPLSLAMNLLEELLLSLLATSNKPYQSTKKLLSDQKKHRHFEPRSYLRNIGETFSSTALQKTSETKVQTSRHNSYNSVKLSERDVQVILSLLMNRIQPLYQSHPSSKEFPQLKLLSKYFKRESQKTDFQSSFHRIMIELTSSIQFLPRNSTINKKFMHSNLHTTVTKMDTSLQTIKTYMLLNAILQIPLLTFSSWQ